MRLYYYGIFQPQPDHTRPFPLRNRVIAALAKAILFVEAGRSLERCRRWMQDWNSAVMWAIPGDIAHPQKRHSRTDQSRAQATDSPEDISLLSRNLHRSADYLDHADQLVFKYYLQGYSAQRIVELTGLPIQQVQNNYIDGNRRCIRQEVQS